MPPGRRPTHSREEYVEAAIRYADEHGLSALTLQAIGTALGVSTTAVYRYFRDKDDLIEAMREHLLGFALASADASADPRETILAAARAFRATAREHPCLGELMVRATLTGANSAAVPIVISGALERLGLHGPLLVRGYRQLESFVVGTAVFDFAGAPAHLSDRLARMARMTPREGMPMLVDAADVDRVNEEAFEATLLLLVNALATEARATTPAS